jgi:hypothetical protein
MYGLVTVTADHNHAPEAEKIRLKVFMADWREQLVIRGG